MPDDSLTKEIQLTQDLMELFIKYQIPSDLLSNDEFTSDGKPSKNALTKVKSCVLAMQEMIKQSKAKELEESKQERIYRNQENDYSDDSSVFAYDVPVMMSFAMASSSAPGRASSSMMKEGAMKRSGL